MKQLAAIMILLSLVACADRRAICEVEGADGLTYLPCTGTVFYE